MTDPDDAYNDQPHDPGNDLAAIAGLGALTLILWTPALIALIAGSG